MAKLERILDQHDIRFISKRNGKPAVQKTISRLISDTTQLILKCDVCGIVYKEIVPYDLHGELLFCNHDQTINLRIKKHLTSKKSALQQRAGRRLTRIIDEVDESVSRHYCEKTT